MSQLHRIVAATILNRAPILTATPHPFEQAFYNYQARLARAISSPLPTDVYFKSGSLLERRFALEERQREKDAFGQDFTPVIGLPVEDAGKSGGKSLADQLEEEASLEEKPQPRAHKADQENDIRSLDRAGERNLYLLVKKPRNRNAWQFPQGGIDKDEALHKVCTAGHIISILGINFMKAALRELKEECGKSMDIWMVGRQPIGHYEYPHPKESQRDGFNAAKVYLFNSCSGALSLIRDRCISSKDISWLDNVFLMARRLLTMLGYPSRRFSNVSSLIIGLRSRICFPTFDAYDSRLILRRSCF